MSVTSLVVFAVVIVGALCCWYIVARARRQAEQVHREAERLKAEVEKMRQTLEEERRRQRLETIPWKTSRTSGEGGEFCGSLRRHSWGYQ